MTFRMLSEARRGTDHTKPETEVELLTDVWRERQPHELVHFRELDDDGNQINGDSCSVCGKPASVWYDSQERWEVHNFRCS